MHFVVSAVFLCVHVQECVDVCVCEHLWLQSGLVCGCMSLASVCKESFSVWVKGGTHGVLEVTPNKKTMTSVCVYLVFYCEWVCCGFGVFGSVSWSVVCVIMWVQSGFGGWCAFACMSVGFCWLFKCGSVWVVKGVWIWRHKKRARNQLQKVGKPK